MDARLKKICETCEWLGFVDGEVRYVVEPIQDGRTITRTITTLPVYICRRYPPTRSGFPKTHTQWPPVELNDWCGEWEQREGVSRG